MGRAARQASAERNSPSSTRGAAARPRPAPSARRTATSRRRAKARVSIRLPTLAHAMRRRQRVAPNIAVATMRSSLPMKPPRRGWTDPASVEAGSELTGGGSRRGIRAPNAAAAWPASRPPASRAITETVVDRASPARIAPMGIQSSLISGNLNPGGITPTIVAGWWSIESVRPSIARSPPNRARQSASLNSTTRGAPGRSSAAISERPSAGATPSVENKLADTRSACTRAGDPSVSATRRPV